MSPESVLIVAPQWVGDSIFMLPAVSALRRQFPRAAFTLLAKPGIRALHAASTQFDAFEAYQPGRPGRLLTSWRLRRKRFGLAVVFPPSFSSGLGAWLSGAKVRVGRLGDGRGIFLNRRLPSADRQRHVSEEYLDLARAAGAEPQNEDKTVRLMLTQDGAEEQNRLFREQGLGSARGGPLLVALCPSSAFGPSKRWGSENYAKLARLLKEQRFHPYLLGAPSELAELEEISEMAGGLPRLTPSLPGLAACLAASGLVVANDSGPLHIAAAVGARCLGLYGPIDPKWSAPLSHRSQVLYTSEPCSPCFERVCPLGHHDCMRHISPESALQTLLELLKR